MYFLLFLKTHRHIYMSVYIYTQYCIWACIYGIHTYTQNIKFCSHNQIIYPRRDNTWMQSAQEHNLFSTARVTYNGQQRRYRRGLQSGLPHSFIIEGSIGIIKNVSWQSQHLLSASYQFYDLFHFMFDLQKCDLCFVLFCHKHSGPSALCTCNQKEYSLFSGVKQDDRYT